MVKSEAEYVLQAEIGGLVMVIGVFGVEELAWSFGICSSGMYVGATAQVKFKVLSFRMKI